MGPSSSAPRFGASGTRVAYRPGQNAGASLSSAHAGCCATWSALTTGRARDQVDSTDPAPKPFVSSEVTGGSPRRAGGATVPAGGGVVLGGCPAEGSGYRTGPVPTARSDEWPVAAPAVPFAGRDGPLGRPTARMPIERLTMPDGPLARYPAAGPAAAGRASGGRAAEGAPSDPAAWLGPVGPVGPLGPGGRLGAAAWLGPVGPVGRLGPAA